MDAPATVSGLLSFAARSFLMGFIPGGWSREGGEAACQ